MQNQLKIIAEIGVNHNGSFKLAKKLVDEAKKCGAHDAGVLTKDEFEKAKKKLIN